jgi:hypothetical protein
MKTKTASAPAENGKAVLAVTKTEDEKSLRGTVSLFRNAKTGMAAYIREKKIFLKQGEGIPTKQVDAVTAGYTIRREYAEKVAAGQKEFVFIHPKLAKCKWGAEASLKLEKMVK